MDRLHPALSYGLLARPAHRGRRSGRNGIAVPLSLSKVSAWTVRTEVRHVTRVLRAVRLHSRPHIDLQRVAGALCSS
ncbi:MULTISPECIES: putative leader peptide [Streptomyces]|uniref:putative leader peptide n=1 Tax=Streptomyces TaxID=1883 RepID=UPI0033D16A09